MKKGESESTITRMMMEIEAKMRLADRSALEQRLRELGAEPVADLLETNIFLDTLDQRLFAEDRGLRVRIERDVTINGAPAVATLTYKGPRAYGAFKSRREIELKVDEAEKAVQLLGELGYRQTLCFEKRRRRRRVRNCNVELDEMPYLGHFVEIEGPDEQSILALRRELNLADTPHLDAGYASMLLAHLERNRVADRQITMADAPAAD